MENRFHEWREEKCGFVEDIFQGSFGSGFFKSFVFTSNKPNHAFWLDTKTHRFTTLSSIDRDNFLFKYNIKICTLISILGFAYDYAKKMNFV